MKAIVLSIFACSLCFTFHLEARTWTSLDGKTIEAEFVKVDKANVTLKRSDGKSFTLPVNKLSEKDNKYITEELVKNAAEKKSDATKITGKIRSPRDGEKVESGFLFKALTRGAPKGYVCVLFTRDMREGALHPRGRILEVNRSITTQVHHGPSDFGEWSLQLYVLPEEDAEGLMTWLLRAEQLAAIGQIKQIKAFDRALMEKAIEVASLKYILRSK